MLSLASQQAWVRVFWLLFGLTIIVIVAMQITGAPLKTAAAPGGIVTFELIGTMEGSQQIINSWQGDTMIWAGINLGLDFLFLTLYGLTIALACLLVSEKVLSPFMKKVGIWLAIGVLAAAVLDVVENISLINLLLGSDNASLPVLAKWCATPKFVLVLLSLLYVLGGIVPAVRNKG